MPPLIVHKRVVRVQYHNIKIGSQGSRRTVKTKSSRMIIKIKHRMNHLYKLPSIDSSSIILASYDRESIRANKRQCVLMFERTIVFFEIGPVGGAIFRFSLQEMGFCRYNVLEHVC